MADPTNPNDATYKGDPEHYVFVNGRWQRRNSSATLPPPNSTPIKAETTWALPPPRAPDGSSIFDPADKIATHEMSAFGVGGEIPNFAGFKDRNEKFRNLAIRAEGTNPYNASVADRSRQAQLALMQQMRAQQAGPSLAALQGQRAMGQLGQQAIGNAAIGGSGRGAMLQAGQMGAGMAGDVAQGRLAEVLRTQGGIGGILGSRRGAALSSAEDQMNSGLQSQALADQRAKFYGTMGSSLANKRAQAANDNEKLFHQLKFNALNRQLGLIKDAAGATASATSTIATSGAKK